MIKSINCIIAALFFALSSTAQQKAEFSRRPQPNPTIKNLKVGDKVPEIIIPNIIMDTKTRVKISDFKEQLLIFDFFDTFCGSCIEALPKLDSLQKAFGKKIKILPVSYQSEEVMRTFFNSNKYLLKKNVKLPCVVEDKILGSHFQYKIISHEIWIYKGVVIAITGTDYVTGENIQTILDGKKVNWPEKNDIINFDPKKPIFVQTDADQYNTKNNFLRHSGITGYRDGIDFRKSLAYDTLTNGYRSYIYNKSIVGAFGMITNKIKKRDFIPHPDRLILEVKDKSKYVFEKGKGFPSDWLRENEFCYELITAKPMGEKERLEYIFEDLQHLLGVNVRWEKRPIKCLIIIKNKDVNIDSVNVGRKGYKLNMDFIPLFYFDQTEKYPPAIDETGIKDKVVIEASKDVDGFRKQLLLYGCDIIEAERNIDVMVITEKGI